jgi:GPH family glycoside/pentoside/hexuronide:cation symporter
MAVPFSLCTIGLFVLPQTASIGLNDTILFILLMVFYLFMTMFCTPYNALIAELGDTQQHRINVSTFISFTFIFNLTQLYFSSNRALNTFISRTAKALSI